jgi:hypothetical protein
MLLDCMRGCQSNSMYGSYVTRNLARARMKASQPSAVIGDGLPGAREISRMKSAVIELLERAGQPTLWLKLMALGACCGFSLTPCRGAPRKRT